MKALQADLNEDANVSACIRNSVQWGTLGGRMRIEFLTEDDSNYILPFFDEFIRQYGSEFQIQQISCSRAMGSRPRPKLFRELLWLYGWFGFSRLALRTLVAHVMATITPSKEGRRAYSIDQLCRAYRIPYQRIENPNSPEFVASIRKRAPDLIVSVACPYILKAPILESSPLGCINIHNAPLPDYKGMMPVFWQIYHGNRQIGLTIHYMGAKVDEGVAVLQDHLVVEHGESLDNLMRRAKRFGAHCMATVLRQIGSGKQQLIEFDHAAGRYFTFPTHEEIRDFRNRGLRAI